MGGHRFRVLASMTCRWLGLADGGHQSGQEVQGSDVLWPHHSEVAPIERRDVTDRQPFCSGNHGTIDRSQWQIAIDPDQFGDTKPVFGSNVLGDQIARGEVP